MSAVPVGGPDTDNDHIDLGVRKGAKEKWAGLRYILSNADGLDMNNEKEIVLKVPIQKYRMQ